MYPRLRLDIRWRDLARGAALCVAADDDAPLPIGASAAGEAIVALSVRSAFDAMLSALDLPQGSEVLVSEVTVPHMSRIIREHGLIPVAVPLDPRTLHIELQAAEDRLTTRTRLMVVAHLFGARTPLGDLGRLARACDFVLVEDCAEALVNGSPHRDTAADVSLFSFGPIKTATALGGGLALVKDEALRRRMREVAERWPRQSRLAHFARVLKIGSLKFCSQPWLFTALVNSIEIVGGDADAFVGGSARGFPDDQLFEHLRQRPCNAIRHLLSHRLAHFDISRVAERTRRGRKLAAAIEHAAFAAGCDNPTHTYWVFPAVCNAPQQATAALRAAGFDASQHSGLTVVGDDSPDHWFRRTVFVPHDSQVPEPKLARAAEALRSAKR